MARYTEKKRKNEFSEIQETMLMAMQLITQKCEVCYSAEMAIGQGAVWFPGRSIAKRMGGRWTKYRHDKLLEIRERGGFIDAHKGIEVGKQKAEVWRYCLTQSGKIYLDNLLSESLKDCVYYPAYQEQLL